MITHKFSLWLLIAAALGQCSCLTLYRNKNEGILFATSGNWGVIQSENSGVQGSLTGVTASNSGGTRATTSVEAQQQSSIILADGSSFQGTIDHSSGMNSWVSGLRNVIVPKAVRDIWLELIGESGQTARRLNTP